MDIRNHDNNLMEEGVYMDSVQLFKIDDGSPSNSSERDNEDSILSEAIYTVFPLNTEDATMSWGDERIKLSYRYDLSSIIDEMLQMVFTLYKYRYGEWAVDWPSNTFAANWHFRWDERSMQVEAVWREEFQASDYLKSHPKLITERDLFLIEWEKVTDVLLNNLAACGYNRDNLADLGLLIEADVILKRLKQNRG